MAFHHTKDFSPVSTGPIRLPLHLFVTRYRALFVDKLAPRPADRMEPGISGIAAAPVDDPAYRSALGMRAQLRSNFALNPVAGNGIFGCRDGAPKISIQTRECLQRPKSRNSRPKIPGETTYFWRRIGTCGLRRLGVELVAPHSPIEPRLCHPPCSARRADRQLGLNVHQARRHEEDAVAQQASLA